MPRVPSDKHAQVRRFRGHPDGGAVQFGFRPWLKELELAGAERPRHSDKRLRTRAQGVIAGSDMHSRHQPGTRGKLLSISDVRGNPPSQTQKLIRSGRVDKVGGLYGPAEAPCWRGTAAPDEAQGRDMASEASRRVAAWCWEGLPIVSGVVGGRCLSTRERRQDDPDS